MNLLGGKSWRLQVPFQFATHEPASRMAMSHQEFVKTAAARHARCNAFPFI
jgi:hypothetical protein